MALALPVRINVLGSPVVKVDRLEMACWETSCSKKESRNCASAGFARPNSPACGGIGGDSSEVGKSRRRHSLKPGLPAWRQEQGTH